MASDVGDSKVDLAPTEPRPGQRERVGRGWLAEDLFEFNEGSWRHELWDGELFRVAPAGEEHGERAGLFFGLLFMHVYAHRLGSLRAAETGYLIRRNPDTVLAPDCSYVSNERLISHKPVASYSELVPDLVAEVVSPGDRPRLVTEKVGRWLDFGVAAVVVIWPGERTITVCRTRQQVDEYKPGQVIDFDFVVPGFQLEVFRIFE